MIIEQTLIVKQKEYIEFLKEQLGSHAMISHIHHFDTSKEDIEKGKQLRKQIASLEKELTKPKFDKSYLDECIKKAEPNLSKIKDIDKELDEIRGIEQKSEISDEEIDKWAYKNMDNIVSADFIAGKIIGAKFMRDKMTNK